jgi:unsaturated rhamnogalacturonyl hydrolase
MRAIAGFAAVCATALTIGTATTTALQTPNAAEPLAIARILAAKYPAQPIMSYIPALSWSNSLRLAAITGEAQWREKPLAQMQPFLSEQTPAIAEPYRLTSLAGALAFADAGSILGNRAATVLAAKVAYFMLPDTPGTGVKFATGWTDDMFMASAVLSRVGNDIPTDVVGRLLTSYAGKLQRPDGLYVHATDGPHAWGRGNGFALLGVTEALTHLPAGWSERTRVLEIYRKHVGALAKLQSDDGSWRQVVDEPTSYRELTVTAMTTAAMARGVRLGWIDRAAYQPIIERGWGAVAARVNPDGTVRDVCSGTGVGPTKEYYLNRPVVNGADDRGGAMALLAAIEVELMRREFR